MIEVLDTDADLEALRPDWDALWRRTPDATPFQSPHWLHPWWGAFGTGLPRVAVRRRRGALVGILPLYVLPSERKALPIGAGTTDYLDALGEPDGLLDAALARMAGEVDVCDLVERPPGSALGDAAPPGWRRTAAPGSACPVLRLGSLPKSAARSLRMNRNRAARAGGWSVSLADAATLPAALDTLVRLHQARWTAHGEPGVLQDPAVLAFWRAAAPGLLEAGLLRLATLRIGPDPAAAFAVLCAPGRVFFYLSGFDEAHAFVSPGSLLLAALLEAAEAEGRTEAHFLRGRERYKYAWGAEDRLNTDIRLTPAG